ncbi:MAG: glycosyl transferase group 1 [Chlorobi bacterium OLB6]|nr:MAG: glycosyl transferase group 1 [Chlorobi bacterium OLB6]
MAHTVLVLAYYYPPMGLSGVQRVAKFTKYLPQYGWNPIVVTTGPTLYYAEDQTLLHEVEAAGVEIVRTEPSLRVKKLLEKGVITMPRESVRKFISKSSSALFVPDNKKSGLQRR